MRILYGIQGTGNGHITRARVMLPALQALGAQVDCVLSGRAADAYFDMELFGRYRCYRGFTFANHNGAVQWGKTLWQADVAQFYRDVANVGAQDYDLVLTDFEPVTAWAAKRYGVPSVGLAHQYALRHPLPGTQNMPWLRWGMGLFAPARTMLGVHWDAFGADIIPPLIALNHHQHTTDDGFVLVYLPFENPDFIRHWLKQTATQHFVVYARVKQIFHEKNLTIKPLSRETFPMDLAACSGVICNSGFGLCSEAMVLGKKILTRAQQGQVEQLSNAKVLAQMGRATVMTQFDQALLGAWLAAPAPPKAQFPHVADAVAKWLMSGCYDETEDLVSSLWANSSHISIAAHMSALPVVA